MKIAEKNKNEMQTGQNYDAPAIEIVEVNAEQGFAQTGGPGGGSTDDGNYTPPPGGGGG